MAKRRLISPTFGAYAGAFALIVLGFVLAGLAWTPLRPAYEGTLQSDGAIELASPEQNVQFGSWISFIAITALLAGIVTVLVLRKFPPRLGVMCWLVPTLLVATASFAWSSDILLHFMVRGTQVGDSLSFVPPLRLGVGVLVAPWVGSVLMFIALLLRAEDDPQEELQG
ncbi:hypothetical protein [Corynebacterium pelargi]|uniref:Uncharacterized protein n=1 Tax=Corynebacterium pelargi TaxID=1471400 RepID=A0A410W7Y7_9CORY|nr:hypothetical protein [Corynebacterium pelargi]QAU52072.1 hypothetical protein CPELA_03965 [Corynebacterium pelargi]GGG70336.1 hypothetical protein GCM10007338_04040 [Corynebacterium pelargi]